jgi:iron(III) transport system permease protein
MTAQTQRVISTNYPKSTIRLPMIGGLVRGMPRIGLRMAALLGVGLVLLPLLYLIVRAAGAGERAVDYLTSGRVLMVIANSIALTVSVSLTSIVIGVPFAWLTTRTDLPFRRVWLIAGLLPLVIPSYIGALAFIAAFGPRGILYSVLNSTFGVESIPTIYGFFGAWLAVTLFTYPYIVLPVRAALLRSDPALEECAQSLGIRRWRLFARVILPQLRPALGVGVLLVALYTLSDFGAVALMQFDAFTRVIYTQYTSSLDRSMAAVLSLVLVVVTIGVLLVERRIAATDKRKHYRAGVGVQRTPKVFALGAWRIPALIFCTLLVGLGLFVPVGVLTVWFVQNTLQGKPVLELGMPALNAVTASGGAAVVAALAAIPLAWLAARPKAKGDTLWAQIAYLGEGLPGIVVALSLVFFAANALPALYQTLPILILGYVVRFLPLSIGATRGSLLQVNPRMEEAARSLACRPWQVAFRVTLPMVRGGILAGAAMVFLNAMKDLPTTLLLSPTGFRTLATQIWTARTEAQYSMTAAPALLLILVSALSLALILRRHE